ncbi:MAG: glycosyltransferase, partial [Acidobacteriota bacterium]
ARYGPRIVIFIGRLVYYKGLDILLRALARVPDATLLIVGEGPKENSLRSLARELRVIDRSIFLGRLSHQEKVACLHACDLLALPAMNRAEAFGQVQVEALACGRPVISTKIDSGVPFVSLDNVCGLTVEPGDAAQLAGAITTLLDDDDLRARLGQAGRRRVEELFSREVMLRDTIALYDAMLGNIEPAGAPQVVLSSNGGRRS